MPTCEMCGNSTPTTRRATIEGTVMTVCGNCVKFGVEIAGPKTEVTGRSNIQQGLDRRAARGTSRDVYRQMEEELSPDYPQLVRDARVRKGWSTKDLGERLKERELTIKHVEAGSQRPPDQLVKKLEKELGVKLMEKPEAPAAMGGQKAGKKALTLGDLLREELEKKKK